MKTLLVPRRPLPKIKFKRGKEVDKITSFTYGTPRIGIELLKDYCIRGNWFLFPTKEVVKIKTNRSIIFLDVAEKREIVVFRYNKRENFSLRL